MARGRILALFVVNLFVLVILSCIVQTTETTRPSHTLIIVEKSTSIPTFKQSNSALIKIIEELGHTVTIQSADDTNLKLAKYGEFLYTDILLLAPQLDSFRGSTNVKEFLEFIDSGRNILIAGNHAPGAAVTELIEEVGFSIKETSAKRDYSNNKLNDISYVVGDSATYPATSFTFSGAQLKMLKSPLTMEILTNNAPVDDTRPSTSSKHVTNVLIGAMQARNNARAIVSGSVEFFTNKAFESSKSANKHLTNELLRWLFKEKSVLRYSSVQHRKLNVDPSPSDDIASKTNFDGYTILDDIEYSIKIELYESGKWSPYTGDDVQLEFVRIDPFVRQTMQRSNDGTYTSKFKVPDVYGVYKFQVDYNKRGLTHLVSTTQVSVRPLRHNQYERFIYSAYPYYLSAFLMMAYLYIFSFVYLYQRKEKRNNK